MSLRTFGDTPDSCETLLVVPPGPLDGPTMADIIVNPPVVNLVRTPIGASLEAVTGDLNFAIEDAALAATFREWASLGNGQYIDAGIAGELNAVVSRAVLPTFDVVDATGTVIASGQVGADPIAVPPGTYLVVIRSEPEIVVDTVVTSAQLTDILVPAP